MCRKKWEVQESRWTLDDIRHAQGGGWRRGRRAYGSFRKRTLLPVGGPSLRRPALELAQTQSLWTLISQPPAGQTPRAQHEGKRAFQGHSSGVALWPLGCSWGSRGVFPSCPQVDHRLPTLCAAPPHGATFWQDSSLPQTPSMEGSSLSAGQALGAAISLEHSGPASGPHRATLTGAVNRSLLWTGVSPLISVCVTSLARLGPCLCQPVICWSLETRRFYNGKVVVRLRYTPAPGSPHRDRD